ncbi:glycosyltransferase family 4 protein [Empedobacter sp. UBA7620]|uniref:glycosyltransferase family 4 protein n=1 Tax=Empedobacter sp. UBA7620 TaxID=1946452 RepID=UPI0025B9EC7F|nr:glycosyltransferase family 4 protein [Empedobacter sp. UBA7620]
MKEKFFLITTVSMSLNFFKEQINHINQFYDVTLISSPSNQLKEIATRENVNYKGIKMNREIALFNDIKSLIYLIIFFLKEKPTVVHCNTPKASLLGLIAAYITRVPNRIYYIHGLRYEGVTGIKRKILITMEKISCFCANKIIAVSFGVKEIVQNDLTPKKVDVIHNGSANGMLIDDFVNSYYNTSEIREELNILKSDFVYGFVGRIVGDKGINELIEAFQLLNEEYKNTKLLLIGFYEEELDPLKKETIERIKNNQNIIELGFQKDVKKYLSIINVFVSPSYREGFGLSLLEANLMGKPVIATKITGYTEIINQGENGFLIPIKNSKELKNKMEWSLLNSKIILTMEDRCVNIVKEKYNHVDVLKHALNYYLQMKKN